MSTTWRRWIAAAALCVGAAAAAANADDEVTINFVNVDIQQVVKAMGIITGRNFLLDPRVKGNVNIVSSRPVTREEAYEIFLSTLRLSGFAAVEGRGFTKIVPEAEAKTSSTSVPEPASTPTGDKVITRVFALKYEPAAQLVPVLRPLITPNNTIAVYPGSNTLIVTDYADNIRRIGRLIESIDQPVSGETVAIRLEHASVTDVAQTLTKLQGEAGAQAGQKSAGGIDAVSIVPDVRSNTLLVSSQNPSRIAQSRSLISALDTPTDQAGNIHVVYLRNAEAPKLAETLRGIVGESAPTAGASSSQASTLRAVSTGGMTAAAPLSAATGSPSGGAGSAGGGWIQADQPTNSLIITAPDVVYNALRAVIDKLDQRRAQVFVEGLIVEVTADRAAEFGVQWQALDGVDSSSTSVIGSQNFTPRGSGSNIVDISANPGTVGQGLSIGVIRGKITLPGVGEILNLGVLARALAADSSVNILSTPNLLTLDNEEAQIVVGQNIPLITGQYALTGSATSPTPFQTIERKDVGLTLRVRPQVSEGGAIKLKIYQEVSSVSDQTISGIITNKRAIESTVLVDDQRIIVLGGLIQDDVRNGMEKVPGLGDIPVIGTLFKYEARKRTKTNLLVFLRPVVLRDAEGLQTLTGDRYEYIRREQEQVKVPEHWLLPETPSPQLPAFGTSTTPGMAGSRLSPVPGPAPAAPAPPPPAAAPPASPDDAGRVLP